MRSSLSPAGVGKKQSATMNQAARAPSGATMAAVTRPPAMPFQMMSIRQPTPSRPERGLSMITCDVIEPIHGNVEEPTWQERYNKAKEAENAEVYCSHD